MNKIQKLATTIALSIVLLNATDVHAHSTEALHDEMIGLVILSKDKCDVELTKFGESMFSTYLATHKVQELPETHPAILRGISYGYEVGCKMAEIISRKRHLIK